MTINAYDIGDLVRCRGEFKDIDEVLTDPAAVFFKVKTPAGVTTTLEYGVNAALVKEAVGTYYSDVSATLTGKYKWKMYSTGGGQAAAEGEFLVKRSAVD